MLPVRPGGRRSGLLRRIVHHLLRQERGARRLYVDEQNSGKCDHALRSLQKAMRWDEETFGREYDLDLYMIVAVDDFNMGAMENKGLNIFNSRYVLASPATATDDDLPGHRGGDRPRILPQLDRQPDHLPRLVSALPEGGTDDLPRPGILRRHGVPRR